jgi:hypothetical protein
MYLACQYPVGDAESGMQYRHMGRQAAVSRSADAPALVGSDREFPVAVSVATAPWQIRLPTGSMRQPFEAHRLR